MQAAPGSLSRSPASVGHAFHLELEAYQGQGNNEPLVSRDVEDLLTVIDGRATLLAAMKAAEPALRQTVAAQITELMAHPNFECAVQSTARDNRQREELIFQRLDVLARI